MHVRMFWYVITGVKLELLFCTIFMLKDVHVLVFLQTHLFVRFYGFYGTSVQDKPYDTEDFILALRLIH